MCMNQFLRSDIRTFVRWNCGESLDGLNKGATHGGNSFKTTLAEEGPEENCVCYLDGTALCLQR